MFRPFRCRAGRAQSATRHHANAVAERKQFGKVGAHDQHGFARPGSTRRAHQLANQRVYLRLATDVDAARRLVEHEHIDVVMEKTRERDFLLVSA
jgi:hypothetical protein